MNFPTDVSRVLDLQEDCKVFFEGLLLFLINLISFLQEFVHPLKFPSTFSLGKSSNILQY